MKKQIVLCLVSVMSFFVNGYSQVVLSKWVNGSVKIDGDASEWGNKLRFFHSDSGIEYDLRNDSGNLYIILKAVDSSLQQQLLQAACKFTFKTSTKPPVKATLQINESLAQLNMPPLNDRAASAMGVNRPQDNRPENFDSGNRQRNGGPKPDFTTHRMQIRDTAITKGFMFSEQTICSNNGKSDGINFNRNKAANAALLEISIPLSEFFGKDYNLASVSGSEFTVLVNIDATGEKNQSREMSRGPGGFGGGPEGGGSGGFGGGPGGEMGGGDMDSRPPMMERGEESNNTQIKKTLKIRFNLSKG